VFAITLPIIVCLVIICVVGYLCWEQLYSNEKTKKAKVYQQQNSNNSTMNISQIQQTVDYRTELEKAGVIESHVS